MINPETKVACSAWIFPFFLRRSMMTGIDPKISITENKIRDEDKISLKLKFIFQ
jgi:hypothetical protein